MSRMAQLVGLMTPTASNGRSRATFLLEGIVQTVEQRTFNPCVGGSNPSILTNPFGVCHFPFPSK